jgi:hypothetical protein
MRRFLTLLPAGLGLSVLVLAGPSGCRKSPLVPPTNNDTGAPETVAGAVRDRLVAGPYTYFRLRADDGTEHWMVVPDPQHQLGARVTVRGCQPRRDFVSRRLDRRFALLNFCSLAKTPTSGARS